MSTDKPFSTLNCAIARHRGLVGIASRREEAALTTGIALAQPKVNKTAIASSFTPLLSLSIDKNLKYLLHKGFSLKQ
ncbi:MAG: hypothetical protein V7L29_32975 [Nostoc sp.]|uniref:hypothetical protein n=1 Tax=Nostoc sp. TaxID=1180 RepID=UPI002FF4A4E1